MGGGGGEAGTDTTNCCVMLMLFVQDEELVWWFGDPAQDSLSDESHEAASMVSVHQVEQQEAMGWVGGGGEAGTMFCQLYCA